MRERRHPNIVAVALADKNARIVWSIFTRGESYRPAETCVAELKPAAKQPEQGGLFQEYCSNLAGDGEGIRPVAS
jgi:hypothetical protein